MNVSKKFFIYILAGMLSICSVSSCYCRSVYAIEWAGGALAFEEALKWALALMGITATTGMTNAYWEEYGDDFTDYAIENGATQTEVANWQMKLCEGILDKGSSIWSSFKTWAKSLVSGGSSSGGSTVTNENLDFQSLTFQGIVDGINTKFGTNFRIENSNIVNQNCYGFYLQTSSNGRDLFLILLRDSGDYTFSFSGTSGRYNLSKVNSSRFLVLQSYLSNVTLLEATSVNGFVQCIDNTYNPSVFTTYISDNIANPDNASFNTIDFVIGSSGGEVADENFQTIQGVDQDHLDVISSLLPDENASEVKIPMPGVGTSDNDISSDAYDELIDAINSGEISLDDGIARIQEILKVIVFDEATDDVIPLEPDPDNPEENKKRMML